MCDLCDPCVCLEPYCELCDTLTSSSAMHDRVMFALEQSCAVSGLSLPTTHPFHSQNMYQDTTHSFPCASVLGSGFCPRVRQPRQDTTQSCWHRVLCSDS